VWSQWGISDTSSPATISPRQMTHMSPSFSHGTSDLRLVPITRLRITDDSWNSFKGVNLLQAGSMAGLKGVEGVGRWP
jgi:hypothetical protein